MAEAGTQDCTGTVAPTTLDYSLPLTAIEQSRQCRRTSLECPCCRYLANIKRGRDIPRAWP
jgi:hypothetical protein